jgi:hypothetical protein
MICLNGCSVGEWLVAEVAVCGCVSYKFRLLFVLIVVKSGGGRAPPALGALPVFFAGRLFFVEYPLMKFAAGSS